MENRPLISVIVPIYKVEKYIHKSVGSILHQTYRNLEIILVDDGSPDSCGKIADEFASEDARVRVIHKKNGGLSDARNAGLKVATGDYIYFFDSDDRASENLLDTALRAYQKEELDLVCFNYIECYENTGEEKKISLESHIYEKRGRGINLVIKEYLSYKRYRLGYCVWNKLYRADIIRSHQIIFEDNARIFSEDICFNLYYILYCKRIRVIPEYLYYYLNRETSIMGKSKKEPRLDQFMEISKRYMAYLQKEQKASVMLNYQEIIFSELMKLQLDKVRPEERPYWIETVQDKDYFYENSRKAFYRIDKWMRAFGFFGGLKRWFGSIEFYYRENDGPFLRMIREEIFRLKNR